MKALVTGGAGFIGSNIVHRLVADGHDVVVLDDMFTGTPGNLAAVQDDIELVEGDVRDRETVADVCEGVDTVFHQAARSSAPMHVDDPAEGAAVNVEGFINVMEQARQGGIDSVVYASTSTMYGSVEPPHREDMGEEPVNLYSASKMSRELYAKVYAEAYGIDTVGLRYFSVFGPRERAKGEYANLVSQFIWAMLDGEQPVIYGDGTQTRDFTFVQNVVDANIRAAQADAGGTVVNVGTGTETTLNELVDLLNDVLGTDIDAEYVENPIDNYVMRTKADWSRAADLLDWEPAVGFEEGVRRTADFYQGDTDG